jgi:hypothetical protein
VTESNRSELATQVEDLVQDRPRAKDPFGHYRSAPYSCHYVCGYDGQLVQVTPDDRRVPRHVP